MVRRPGGINTAPPLPTRVWRWQPAVWLCLVSKQVGLDRCGSNAISAKHDQEEMGLPPSHWCDDADVRGAPFRRRGGSHGRKLTALWAPPDLVIGLYVVNVAFEYRSWRTTFQLLASKIRTSVTALNDNSPERRSKPRPVWVLAAGAGWFAAIALLKGSLLFRWLPLAKMARSDLPRFL